jgi:FKBP-type peptidyl-prolyl cis-trans isomerase FkpA
MIRRLLLLLPLVLVAQTPPPKPRAAKPAKPKPAAVKPAPLTTDEQKIAYALGLNIHRSLVRYHLSPAELELVKRGITDAAAGKPRLELNEWGPKFNAFGGERAKAAAKPYLDKAATEPGAVRTETGLVYRELTPGTGESPKATDRVQVHYRGTLTDGTEFDSSYKRNAPAQFPLNNVIRCWTEGVQKMKVGGKSLLVCPSDIAYGDQGRPPVIPGGATLVFEVELLGINP